MLLAPWGVLILRSLPGRDIFYPTEMPSARCSVLRISSTVSIVRHFFVICLDMASSDQLEFLSVAHTGVLSHSQEMSIVDAVKSRACVLLYHLQVLMVSALMALLLYCDYCCC